MLRSQQQHLPQSFVGGMKRRDKGGSEHMPQITRIISKGASSSRNFHLSVSNNDCLALLKPALGKLSTDAL